MQFHLYILFLLFSFSAGQSRAQDIYELKEGNIRFFSEAANEIIDAASKKLIGVIDISKKQFAFKVDMTSFQGFNSPLQREHFNENYMESVRFPEATFSGKIIEDVSLLKEGEHKIRAKGKLNIHGISQERIIYVTIDVKDGKASINSDFIVALADHDIKIPRVVYDKLAPEINVIVTGVMVPRK